MAGRQKEHEVIEIAGVPKVEDKTGCSEPSRTSVIIRLIPTRIDKLRRKGFQKDQAKKLWEGLHGNLPYGIYRAFVELILKHEEFLKRR